MNKKVFNIFTENKIEFVKKINSIFLLVILITSTAIGLFVWDKIYIPTDGYLVGYEAIKDINYHPKTDTLRFFVFIIVSLIPFYFCLIISHIELYFSSL